MHARAITIFILVRGSKFANFFTNMWWISVYHLLFRFLISQSLLEILANKIWSLIPLEMKDMSSKKALLTLNKIFKISLEIVLYQLTTPLLHFSISSFLVIYYVMSYIITIFW